MTWILGSAVPFGYGALISDVRATFVNGRPPFDGVQKVHEIGNGLIAGFAGSIKVGFGALAHLQRGWGVGQGQLYPVHRAAWEFGHWWRRYYRHIRPELRALGCELILAGVSPFRNGPFALSRAAILRAPDFKPQFVVGRWDSIGSGSSHQTAQDYANADQLWPYYQSETSNPGGAAFSIAISIARDLDRDPMADVSSKLQIGCAWSDRTELSVLRRQERGAWTIAKRQKPEAGEFITSWQEFEDAVGAADALGAVAPPRLLSQEYGSKSQSARPTSDSRGCVTQRTRGVVSRNALASSGDRWVSGLLTKSTGEQASAEY